MNFALIPDWLRFALTGVFTPEGRLCRVASGLVRSVCRVHSLVRTRFQSCRRRIINDTIGILSHDSDPGSPLASAGRSTRHHTHPTSPRNRHPHPASVIRHLPLSSPIGSVIRHPPIRHPSSAIRHPSSAICSLSSAIRHLPSAFSSSPFSIPKSAIRNFRNSSSVRISSRCRADW